MLKESFYAFTSILISCIIVDPTRSLGKVVLSKQFEITRRNDTPAISSLVAQVINVSFFEKLKNAELITT